MRPVPPGDEPAQRGRGRSRVALTRRIGLIVLGILVFGFVGLYATAYAVGGDGVPRGTTVLGVEIGGMSTEQAEQTLSRELPAVTTRTVTVQAAEQTFTLDAERAGLDVNAQETVARAGQPSLDPGSLLPALFGARHPLEPVLAVDEVRLAKTVDRIAKKVDQAGREGKIRFDAGKAEATRAREARALDVNATSEVLRDAFISGASAVTAPVEVTPPTIGNDEVDRAMRQFARPAMGDPVTLAIGKDEVVLDSEQLSEYLSMRPDGPRLVPELDAEKLTDDLSEDNDDIIDSAVDASFTFVDGKPKVVPGKVGKELDSTALGASLLRTLPTAGDRRIDVALESVEPDLTTAEAKNLGVTEKLGSFSTSYPYAEYRVNNLGRAAELLNETLVLPGDTFSYNDTLGERTRDNGFIEGYIISGGRFVKALGGGVSQGATTVFNAMFFSGLEDVEHHPHSLYISRYPEGREATVYFGSKDLRFRNDSGHGVLIQAKNGDGKITVTMWGTKVYDDIESITGPRHNFREPDTITSDDPNCAPQSSVDGFDVDVTRVFVKDGDEVKRETFHTTYAPTDAIVCN